MSNPACPTCHGIGRQTSYTGPRGYTHPCDWACLSCCARCGNLTTPAVPVKQSGWCISCEDEARAEAIFTVTPHTHAWVPVTDDELNMPHPPGDAA